MLPLAGEWLRGAGLIARRPRWAFRCGTCTSNIARLSSHSHLSENASGLKGLYGTPQLMDRLEALCVKNPGIERDVDLYHAIYPFQLDDFQVNGLKALIWDKNVLVCTPTGSGKTVVGELAIYYSLMKGQRLIYTTPLKALSNQKYLDFCRRFGEHRVGLHTGDTKLNSFAQIVIMTTEIFRNSIYSRDPALVANTFAVCFDEFHYMNDAERGTVWEESIIACPSDVRIIALSATMGNVSSIRDWISTIHGPTELLTSTYRPVPLEYSYFINKRLFSFFAQASVGPGSRATQTGILAAADSPAWRLHPRLVSQARRLAKQTRSRSQQEIYTRTVRPLVQQLSSQQHLPALLFSFSRALCDYLAESLCTDGVHLLTTHEVHRVRLALSRFLQQYPSLPVSKQAAHMLEHGIATHHAGHIPPWKAFIEQLFQAGLVKVLLCTDTLAAGMNMPARTSVFLSTLRTRAGRRLPLRTSEVLQMAGRAGRRGMDRVGYVVFAHDPEVSVHSVHSVLVGGVEGVESKFHMSFGMVRRLVQTRSLADCRALVLRGFGSFLHGAQWQETQRPSWGQEGQEGQEEEEGEWEREYEREAEEDWGEEEGQDWEADDWEQQEEEEAWEEAGEGAGDRRDRREWDEEWRRIRREDNPPAAWNRFLRVHRVLHHHQALPGQANSELGLRITQLSSYNDLWIALVWSEHDLLSCLSPNELAALMATVCVDRMKRVGAASKDRRQGEETGRGFSKAMRRTFKHIRALHKRVARIQDTHAVPFPCVFTPQIAAAAMHWAEGGAWREVCQECAFAQGDLHRALKQAADLLQQVAHMHAMPQALSAKLVAARKALHRFPVSDSTLVACVQDSGEAETPTDGSVSTPIAPQQPEDACVEESEALGHEEERLLRSLQRKTRNYSQRQARRATSEASPLPSDHAASRSERIEADAERP